MSYFNQTLFDPSNMSVFGSLEAVDLTPIIQGDFVYGLNTQTWNSAVYSGTTANVTTSSGLLQVVGSTASSGYAYITTRKIVRYRAGQGNVVRFTPIFTTGVANTLQIMGVGTIASNTPYDGYFFGYNGTSFGIFHYNRGNSTTAAFIPQTSWNGDMVDGSSGTSFTYIPANGTPVMIKYPYLGFGDIEFFMQIPTTGRWTLIHTIEYANAHTVTQSSNPSLQFLGFVSNSATATSMVLGCGSFCVLLSGVRNFVGNPRWAMDNNVSSISSTETPLFSIQNCTSYNGVTNRGMMRLNSFSMGIDGSNIGTVYLKLNATLTDATPNWTTVDRGASHTGSSGGFAITNGNSIALYDTSATGITAATGTYIYNMSCGANGANALDLTPFELFLVPGDTLTVSGKSTGGSNTIVASLNWSEDI